MMISMNLLQVRQSHFLIALSAVFRAKSRTVTNLHDSLYQQISSRMGEEEFIKMREKDYNENLADIVMNNMTTNKIYDAGDRFIQKADPVFMHPGSRTGRAHFFAPYKQIGDLKIGTLLFNVIVIWIMVIVLFVTLYYNVLKRFIAFLESLKLPILQKVWQGSSADLVAYTHSKLKNSDEQSTAKKKSWTALS